MSRESKRWTTPKMSEDLREKQHREDADAALEDFVARWPEIWKGMAD